MNHRGFHRVVQRFAALATGVALLTACVEAEHADPAAQRLAEAVEQVLARANLGFELSDPDLFDSLIEITSPTTAKHVSTWLVVMKTNVDIHMSAVGRYEDDLVKRDGSWFIAKRRRIE